MEAAGVEGSAMAVRVRRTQTLSTGRLQTPVDASGRDRTIAVATLATPLAAAVLDGDLERAATIARAILAHGLT